MKAATCLNCCEPVEKKFCPNCGQKTDTHRITIKHFVMHDLLHGVWHIDKGIWFTIRQAVKRPGKAALDYIHGQRISFYNVFYLCLLILAFDALVLHFLHQIYPLPEQATSANNKGGNFLTEYAKFFFLAIVPLLAINGRLMLRRLKLNIAEHFILSGMSLLGMLLVFTLLIVLIYAVRPFGVAALSYSIFYGMIAVALLYPMRVYWNALGNLYRTWPKIGLLFAFGLLVYAQLYGIIYFLMDVLIEGDGIEVHIFI